MTTSEHWQLPEVIEVISREQPRSVLDVGAGWGKFGVLAREYAEPSRVDAVDVNPPRYPVYDNVYLGDLRNLDRVLPAEACGYDLALFIEVIEHLEKGEAWAVLEQLFRRARRVLVTTPLGFRPQEIPGMPYESHRSGWYPWEFQRRCVVYRWKVYPGYYTRVFRLPRLWQMLVLVGPRGSAPQAAGAVLPRPA